MRRLLGVVVCMVLAGPAVPAASGERPPPTTGWTQTGAPSPVRELSALRGRALPLDEFQELRHRLVTGVHAASAAPLFVFPGRLGDVDGDGRRDVATIEYVDDAATLRVRRGTDGSELWNAPNVFGFHPVDVEGDGRTEILTVSLEFVPVAQGLTLALERVRLHEGGGGDRWSILVFAAIVRTSTDVGSFGADVNFVTSLGLMPDATADGRPDVWLGTSAGAFVDGEVFLDLDTFAGRTIDLTTGVEVGRVQAAGANGLPWAVPTADLSGDGLADVLSVSGLEIDAGLLVASTTFGSPHWAVGLESSQVYLSSAELDGDGRADALAQISDGGAGRRAAYDGATGAMLWTRPDNGYLDVAGDIDGDGGADLTLLAPTGGILTVHAISGATGQTLWGPVAYGSGSGMWFFCVCPEDLTGDGVWDPLVAELDFATGVTVSALSGRSGAVRWSFLLGPGQGFPLPLGADADGDGAQDIATSASLGSTLAVTVARGPDLGPLWSVSSSFDGFMLGFYGDDLTGDGAPEVVGAEWRLTEEAAFGSASAHSSSGLLWRVP